MIVLKMADSEGEYDLDSLAAMLDDDDMTPQDEKGDLDALAGLLDDDGDLPGTSNTSMTQPSASADSPKNTSMAELGLVMSDDEDEAKAPPQKSKSGFGAAFSGSKFSKGGTASSEKAKDSDPLEAELRQMEERMNLLREQLAKKKKFDHKGEDSGTRRFTKLTNVTQERSQVVRTLSDKEEAKLYQGLKRKSLLHGGETDSEDEDDNRNPFEQQLNDYGREIKKRIAHASDERPPDTRKQEVLNKMKSPPAKNPGWKDLSGSLVSLKSGGTPTPEFEKNVSVDRFSGIRIVNPLVSGNVMAERMEGRKMVRMCTINLHLRGGEIEGDWVTIGVLVSKSQTKTSQKGSQYSIWKLSDLTDCTKTVGLFLFSGAHKQLWKSSVGTVVGLLNPQIMKDRQGDKCTDLLTLSIYDHNKAMIMGSSKDLGWCKGRTKQNSQCRNFVNKASCEFCMFHIQREYQKTSSRRADIQSSFTRVDPRARLQEKILGKDQVFYGGQLYSSPAPGTAPKQARANRAKDLATLNSLKLKLKTNELKEEDKKKSFVLKHMSDEEISAVQNVAKKNESLSEMLLAPTPGARNLLCHMAKKNTQQKVETGEIRSVSAKELLAMQHKQMQSLKRQKQGLSQESLPSARSTLSQQSSPSTGRPKLSAFPGPSSPMLGRGLQPGEEVELDFTSPPRRLDPAKARALALVQKKGGIEASNRNEERNARKSSDQKFQEKVRKRLNTSSDSESVEQPSKRSRLAEAVSSPSRSKLGSIDVNSDKYKAMLEQKSRHTNLINAVEDEAVEKYYKNLEKKEMLEDKMASIMEMPTTAYVCLKCKYMAQSASDMCREENHPLKTVKVKKRFFECKNCKRRTSSLDKLPRNPCGHCNHSSWQRCAMGKAKSGPKLDSEILSLRGDELAHYSASSNQVYLHI